MTHEELRRKIAVLKLSTIESMSPDSFAILTDIFSEELCREIIVQAETNHGQRERLSVVMDKYDAWKKQTDPTWGVLGFKPYPKYLKEFKFNIECGEIIEDERAQMVGSLDDFPIDGREPIGTWDDDDNDDKEVEELKRKHQESIERIAELEAELKSRDERIAEKDAEIASLKQQLEQGAFHSTKPEDAILKEEIERQKQKREDMLVELLLPSFYNIEADARRFVKEIDNGMDSDGVAEVARRYYSSNKILKSKRGRSLWEILHAAKLYDKVEQSWTGQMRKAD